MRTKAVLPVPSWPRHGWVGRRDAGAASSALDGALADSDGRTIDRLAHVSQCAGWRQHGRPSSSSSSSGAKQWLVGQQCWQAAAASLGTAAALAAGNRLAVVVSALLALSRTRARVDASCVYPETVLDARSSSRCVPRHSTRPPPQSTYAHTVILL